MVIVCGHRCQTPREGCRSTIPRSLLYFLVPSVPRITAEIEPDLQKLSV